MVDQITEREKREKEIEVWVLGRDNPSSEKRSKINTKE